MRRVLTLALLAITLRAMPQAGEAAGTKGFFPDAVGMAEFFFDDASVGYGQGISLTVPFNTGDVVITAEPSVIVLSPGFHTATFRVWDTLRGWSQTVTRTFLKPWPRQNIASFRYRIDASTGAETWTNRAFPSPSTDVIMDLEIDVASLPAGVHFVEVSARSANGIWSHINKGTFFSYSNVILNIKALEYYFEDESGAAGPILSVSNFTPSPHITLDSVTFSVPFASLVNLKKYYIYVRAVDEAGNRGMYMKDTILYHAYSTGIRDQILLTPELIVFPNPGGDLVNVRLVTLDQTGDMIIRVFDNAGRIVTEEKFSFSGTDHYSFSASGLAKGVYRIAIFSSAGRPVARATFIKN